MKISIILPTKNEYIVNFFLYVHKSELDREDVEVIVVSNFDNLRVHYNNNILLVKDLFMNGNVMGHVQGVHKSSGDIIVTMCDDLLLNPGFIDNILKLFSTQTSNKLFYGIQTPYVMPVINKCFYAWFPVVGRSVVDEIGHYSSEFKSHFADVDYTLRAKYNNIEVRPALGIKATSLPTEWTRRVDDTKDINFLNDFKTFKNKHKLSGTTRELLYEVTIKDYQEGLIDKNNSIVYSIDNHYDIYNSQFTILKKIFNLPFNKLWFLTKLYRYFIFKYHSKKNNFLQ